MQVDKKSLNFRLMCQFTDLPELKFTPLNDGDCFGRHSHCWYLARLLPELYPNEEKRKKAALRCFFRFYREFGEN